MRLTKKQKEVLTKMAYGVWYSAYDLSVGLGTMNSLALKGLVESKRMTGSSFFPRIHILWKKKSQIEEEDI